MSSRSARSLRTFPSRAEAEVVQGLLASAGIESLIVSDDAGRAYPFPLGDGVRLLVEEGDYEAAAAVLADAGQNGVGNGGTAVS
jgi:hypothetical protein